MDDQVLLFDDELPTKAESTVWRILAVDDDPDFQRATAFALNGLRILDGRIELLQAFSYREASMLLAERQDIALVLLDVVMETDDAGLRLIRVLREVIGNAEVRIVMLTGEPGMAPVHEVMADYDINDYWTKSELGAERLLTVLTGGIRAYSQLRAVARARRGLQMIVESSNALFCSHSTQELSSKILSEIAAVLDVQAEGIVCVRAEDHAPAESENVTQPMIISASGRFSRVIHEQLSALDQPEIEALIQRCLHEQKTLLLEDCTVLFFSRFQAGADYACYVATGRALDETELELLKVFSVSISRGLYNVSLFSRLEEMAYQDDLLKMPNRNALVRMLDMVLQGDARAQQVLVVIDIDNFSGVNTAFGTGYGDFILGLVAKRLRDAFAGNVLVTRIRDDQFAILGPENEVAASAIVGLFRRQRRPYELGQVHSLSSVTLRLSEFVGSASVALQSAHLALKQAKALGHDQHVCYDPKLQTEHADAYRMLLALRDAVEGGRISIHLQPQVNLHTGKVTGLEALARWRRENGQLVPPIEFIPLAEATGYILPLGDFLLRLALIEAAKLAAAGYVHLRIAVNVSAPQLLQHDYVERFSQLLESSGVLPTQIEVEITESVAMRSFDIVCEKLTALRTMGVTVAIDDFGTGFSSLSYLRRLPADRLKIDRSFINEIGEVQDRELIAAAVIQIASRVGMQVIAEGVENQQQADWILAHGCHEAQGYMIAKPMPSESLLEWLQSWTERTT